MVHLLFTVSVCLLYAAEVKAELRSFLLESVTVSGYSKHAAPPAGGAVVSECAGIKSSYSILRELIKHESYWLEADQTGAVWGGVYHLQCEHRVVFTAS